MTSSQKITWSYVACVALAIGSIRPWATLGPFTKDGTDGDGTLTLIGAGLVALAIWQWSKKKNRRVLIAGTIVAGLCALTCVIDFFDIQGEDAFSVGWGLIFALVASIALTAMNASQLRR